MKDEAGTADETDEEKCLEKIKVTLAAVKEEYAEVEKVLKKFYGN
jgi:osomolarity two-component system phosphorelay intermediate protein YPD1